MKHRILFKSAFCIAAAFFAATSDAQEVKNPLSQVAEYNLKADGTLETGDPETAYGDYFFWDDALTAAMPEGHHLPSRNEALVIFGAMQTVFEEQVHPFPKFNFEYESEGDEEVSIWGEEATYYSYYRCNGENICYALRFIGGENKYLSAYRWEVLLDGNQVDGMFGPEYTFSAIEITCRLIGPDGKDMTINDIANESYWESSSDNDVIRYIPAAGCQPDENVDDIEDEEVRGRYWTSSVWKNPKGADGAYGFGVDAAWAYIYSWGTHYGYSIRPFLDAENQNDTGIEENTCDSRKANFFYDGSSILAADRMIYDIEVYDISGMKIFASYEDASKYYVNLENGLYLIKYKTSSEGKYQTMKMVIK